MARQKNIDDIIQNTLHPRLNSECERLGIAPSFIKGIYAIYPKPWEYGSLCEPVEKDGSITGVRIRIDTTIASPSQAKRDFWHEMRHAKDYYEGGKHSELKAFLYSWRRYFEELFHF